MTAPHVSDETLDALREIPTQTAIDAMYKMGWPMTFVAGALPLSPGQQMAGRAVTLRFVPARPDLQADKPKDELSAEYVAIERLRFARGAGDRRDGVAVLVGRRRHQVLPAEAAGARRGIVTDGGVRDSRSMKAYGFPVYCASLTAKQGGAEFLPWQCGRRDPVRWCAGAPRRRCARGRRRGGGRAVGHSGGGGRDGRRSTWRWKTFVKASAGGGGVLAGQVLPVQRPDVGAFTSGRRGGSGFRRGVAASCPLAGEEV